MSFPPDTTAPHDIRLSGDVPQSRLGESPKSESGSHISSSPDDSQWAMYKNLSFTGRINDDIEIFDEEDFMVEEEEEDGSPSYEMKRQLQELEIYSTIDEESQEEYPLTTSAVTTEDEGTPAPTPRLLPSGKKPTFQMLKHVAPPSSDSGSRSDVESFEEFHSDSYAEVSSNDEEAMGDIFAKEQARTRPGTPGGVKRKSESETHDLDDDFGYPDESVPRYKLPRLEIPYMAELKAFLLNYDSRAHYTSMYFQQSVHFDETSVKNNDLDQEKDVDIVGQESQSSELTGTRDLSTHKSSDNVSQKSASSLSRTHSTASTGSFESVRRKSSVENMNNSHSNGIEKGTTASDRAATPVQISTPPKRKRLIKDQSFEDFTGNGHPRNPFPDDIDDPEFLNSLLPPDYDETSETPALSDVSAGSLSLNKELDSITSGEEESATAAYDADPEDDSVIDSNEKPRKKKRNRTLNSEDREKINIALESMKGGLSDTYSSIVSASAFEEGIIRKSTPVKTESIVRQEQSDINTKSKRSDVDRITNQVESEIMPTESWRKSNRHMRLLDSSDSSQHRLFEAHMTSSVDPADRSEISIDFTYEGDQAFHDSAPVLTPDSRVEPEIGANREKSGELRRIGRKSRSQLNLSIEKEIDLERELDPEIGKLKRSPRLSRSQFDLSKERWVDLDLHSLRRSHRLSTSSLDVRKEKHVDLDSLSRSRGLSMSQMEISKEKEVDLDSINRSKKLSTSQLDIHKQMKVDLEKRTVRQELEINNNSGYKNQNFSSSVVALNEEVTLDISSNITLPELTMGTELESDHDELGTSTVSLDPTRSRESSMGRTVSTEYINLIHIDNINHIDPKTGLPIGQNRGSGRGRGKERYAPVNFSFDLSGMLTRDHRSRPQSFERTRSLTTRRQSTTAMEGAYKRSRSHDVAVEQSRKRKRTVSTEFVNRVDLGEMGKRKERKYDPVTFKFDISGLLSESLRKIPDNLDKMTTRRNSTSIAEYSKRPGDHDISKSNLTRRTMSTDFINSVYLGEMGSRRPNRFDPVAFRFHLAEMRSQQNRGNEQRGRSHSSRRHVISMLDISSQSTSLSPGARRHVTSMLDISSGSASLDTSIRTRTQSTEFINHVNLGEMGLRKSAQYDPVTFKFDIGRLSRSGSLSPDRRHVSPFTPKPIKRRQIYGSVDQIPEHVKKHYHRAVDKYQNRRGIAELDDVYKTDEDVNENRLHKVETSMSISHSADVQENGSIDSQSLAPFNHLRRFWETGQWDTVDLDITMADDPGDFFPEEETSQEPDFRKSTGNLFFIGRKIKRARHQSDSNREVKVRKISRSSQGHGEIAESEPRKISLDLQEGPTFIEIQSSKLLEVTSDEGIQCEEPGQVSYHSNTLEVQVHGRIVDEGIQCYDSIGQVSNLSISLLDLSPAKASMIANKSFDLSLLVDVSTQCDDFRLEPQYRSDSEVVSTGVNGLSFMEIQSSRAGLDTTEVGIQISGPDHVNVVDRAIQHDGFDHLIRGYVEDDSLNSSFSTGHKLSSTGESSKDSSSKSRPMSVTSGTQYETTSSEEKSKDRLNMSFLQIESGSHQRQSMSQGIQAGLADVEESHSSSLKIMPSERNAVRDTQYSSSLKVVPEISDTMHNSGLKIIPQVPAHTDYMDTQMYSSALNIVPSQPSDPVRLTTVSQGTQFDDWESVRELDISHDSGNFMFLEISSAGQTSSLSNLTSMRFTQSLDEGLNRIVPSESSFILENEAFELQFFRPTVEHATAAVITEGTQWDPEDFDEDGTEDLPHSRSLEFLQIQSNRYGQESNFQDLSVVSSDSVPLHDSRGEFDVPVAKAALVDSAVATDDSVGVTTTEMSTQSDIHEVSTLVSSSTQYDVESSIDIDVEKFEHDSMTQTDTIDVNKTSDMISQRTQDDSDTVTVTPITEEKAPLVDSTGEERFKDELDIISQSVDVTSITKQATSLVEPMHKKQKPTGKDSKAIEMDEPVKHEPEPRTVIIAQHDPNIVDTHDHDRKTDIEIVTIASEVTDPKELHQTEHSEVKAEDDDHRTRLSRFAREDSGHFESLGSREPDIPETFEELQFVKSLSSEGMASDSNKADQSQEGIERDSLVTEDVRKIISQTATPVARISVHDVSDIQRGKVPQEFVQISDEPDMWQGFVEEKVLVLKEHTEKYELKPDPTQAIRTVISDMHTKTMNNIRQRKTPTLTPVQVRMRERPDIEHLSDEDLDGVEAKVSGVKKKVSRHVKFTGKWGNRYKEIESNRRHRGDYDDDRYDFDEEMESYELEDQIETGQKNRPYGGLDTQDIIEGYGPLRKWPPLESYDNATIDEQREAEDPDHDVDSLPDQWDLVEESQHHVDSSELSEPSEVEHDDTEIRIREEDTVEDESLSEGLAPVEPFHTGSLSQKDGKSDQWDIKDETEDKFDDVVAYEAKEIIVERVESNEVATVKVSVHSHGLSDQCDIINESFSVDSGDEKLTQGVSSMADNRKFMEKDRVQVSYPQGSQQFSKSDHELLNEDSSVERGAVENIDDVDETKEEGRFSVDEVPEVSDQELVKTSSGDSDTIETGSTIRDPWAKLDTNLSDLDVLSPRNKCPDSIQTEKHHIRHDSGEESSDYTSDIDTVHNSDDEIFKDTEIFRTVDQIQDLDHTQEDIVYEEDISIEGSFDSYDTAEEDNVQLGMGKELVPVAKHLPEINKEEVEGFKVKTDEGSTRVFSIVCKESKGNMSEVDVSDDSEVSLDNVEKDEDITGFRKEKYSKISKVKKDKGDIVVSKGEKFIENAKEKEIREGRAAVKRIGTEIKDTMRSVENVKEKRSKGGKRLVRRIERNDDFSDDNEFEYDYSSSEFSSDEDGIFRTPVLNLAVEDTQELEERPVGQTAMSWKEKDKFVKEEAKIYRIAVIAPENVSPYVSERFTEEEQKINVAPSRFVDDVTSDGSELDISYPESRSPEVVSPEPEIEEAQRFRKLEPYEFVDVSDEDSTKLVNPSKVDVKSVEAHPEANEILQEASKKVTRKGEEAEPEKPPVANDKDTDLGKIEEEDIVPESDIPIDLSHIIGTNPAMGLKRSSITDAKSQDIEEVKKKIMQTPVVEPQSVERINEVSLKKVPISAQKVEPKHLKYTGTDSKLDFSQVKLKPVLKPVGETKQEPKIDHEGNIEQRQRLTKVELDADEDTAAKVPHEDESTKPEIADFSEKAGGTVIESPISIVKKTELQQTWSSPKFAERKSVEPTRSRKRESSPERPHIEQVKLRKTGHSRKEITKEETETVETKYDLKKDESETKRVVQKDDNKDVNTNTDVQVRTTAKTSEMSVEQEIGTDSIASDNAPTMTVKQGQAEGLARGATPQRDNISVNKEDLPQDERTATSSTSVDKQAGLSPEPFKLKSVTPSPSRRREPSPERPNIEQVNLRKTNIFKREIPEEEIETGDLQETLRGMKKSDQNIDSVELKKIPKAELAVDRDKIETVEFNEGEMKNTMKTGLSKPSVMEYDKKPMPLVETCKSNKMNTSTTEIAESVSHKEIVVGDKYGEGLKSKETKENEAKKLNAGKSSLKASIVDLETVTIKPVSKPLSDSVEPVTSRERESSPERPHIEQVKLRKTDHFRNEITKEETETVEIKYHSKDEAPEAIQVPQKDVMKQKEQLSLSVKRLDDTGSPGIDRSKKDPDLDTQGKSKTSSTIESRQTSLSPELFKLKSVTPSPSRSRERSPERPHIEQVELRKTKIGKREICKEELETVNLQETEHCMKESDEQSAQEKLKKVPEAKNVTNEAGKETVEVEVTKYNRIEKDTPDLEIFPAADRNKSENLDTKMAKVSKEADPSHAHEKDTETKQSKGEAVRKRKLGKGSLKEDVVDLQTVTLKPIPRLLATKEKIKGTEESREGAQIEHKRLKPSAKISSGAEKSETDSSTKHDFSSVRKTKLEKTSQDIDASDTQSDRDADIEVTATEIKSKSSSTAVSRQASLSPEPFKLKSVTSSPSRGRERSLERPHIEQVKLRKTNITKREIPTEELGTVDLQETVYDVKESDKESTALKQKKVAGLEKITDKPRQGYADFDESEVTKYNRTEKATPSEMEVRTESLPLGKSSKSEKLETDIAKTQTPATVHKETISTSTHGRGTKPKESKEDEEARKLKLGTGSLKEEAVHVETVTLKPIPNLQSSEEKIKATQVENLQIESKKQKVIPSAKISSDIEKSETDSTKYDVPLIRKPKLEKTFQDVDASKIQSDTIEDTEIAAMETKSTSSSTAVSRQTSLSPEPFKLKSVTPSPSRSRERSPERLHIEQVKLRKTNIGKREIPREELETVALQETEYDLKEGEQDDRMVQLKKVPKKETVTVESEKVPKEYRDAEIRIYDIPDRSKSHSFESNRERETPTQKEEPTQEGHDHTTKDPLKDSPREILDEKEKYERQPKTKENNEEETRKLELGKGSLKKDMDTIETVTLKPVLRSAEQEKIIPNGDRKQPMHSYKPTDKSARPQDGKERVIGDKTTKEDFSLKEKGKSKVEDSSKDKKGEDTNKGPLNDKESSSDEEEKKLKMGKDSIKFEDENQESVILKPIPKTQTLRTVESEKHDDPNRKPLLEFNLRTRAKKSAEETKTTLPDTMDTEEMPAEYVKEVKYQMKEIEDEESGEEDTRELEIGKGSLKDDIDDKETANLRPVLKESALQEEKDEKPVYAETPTSNSHSRVRPEKPEVAKVPKLKDDEVAKVDDDGVEEETQIGIEIKVGLEEEHEGVKYERRSAMKEKPEETTVNWKVGKGSLRDTETNVEAIKLKPVTSSNEKDCSFDHVIPVIEITEQPQYREVPQIITPAKQEPQRHQGNFPCTPFTSLLKIIEHNLSIRELTVNK